MGIMWVFSPPAVVMQLYVNAVVVQLPPTVIATKFICRIMYEGRVGLGIVIGTSTMKTR